MEKHYFDISNAKEKIVHILYAGYVCDYYEDSIIECINEFGEELTKKGVEYFEKHYKENSKILK